MPQLPPVAREMIHRMLLATPPTDETVNATLTYVRGICNFIEHGGILEALPSDASTEPEVADA